MAGVSVKASSWKYRAVNDSEDTGAQIDFIIERADKCINLGEVNLVNAPYTVTKEYAEKLRWKKECFRQITKTKYSLFTTMITPIGVIEDAQYHSAVDNQLTLDVLFQ